MSLPPEYDTASKTPPPYKRSQTSERIRQSSLREAEKVVAGFKNRQLEFAARRKESGEFKDTGGILSNLLQIYQADDGASGMMSRTTSYIGSQKADSDDEEKEKKGDSGSDNDDAKSTISNFTLNKRKRRRMTFKRASSYKLDAKDLLDPVDASNHEKMKHKKLVVANNVASLLKKYEFILKLAKAFMTFGAPDHRLEAQLLAASTALNINAQFIHIPTIIIVCFGDPETHTSETHFVKASGGIHLTNLHNVHEVYRQVVHSELSVEEGSTELTRILRSDSLHSSWFHIFLGCFSGAVVNIIAFQGSLVDALATFWLVFILQVLKTKAAATNAAYENIAEITIATGISFISRFLAHGGYFCYQSLASSSVVHLVPAYSILCGSLELASRHIISGSVKLVFAIIYSLFIGFGLAVGSQLYTMFDPKDTVLSNVQTWITHSGTFELFNGTTPGDQTSWTGSFIVPDDSNKWRQAILAGTIYCERRPDAPWWEKSWDSNWLFIWVPILGFIGAINNKAKVRSRQFPVIVALGIVGWGSNKAFDLFIHQKSDVVSFLSAFIIGILGNLYSRIFKGTAFTAMASGVTGLVPAGIGASGGLIMADGEDMYLDSLKVGFRIVSVSIGITCGLFFASFVVYCFAGSKAKNAAVFAF